MTVDGAYKADKATITKKILIEKKSSVFILIKVKKYQKFEFPNDCGAQKRHSGTAVNSTYAINKLKTVFIKKGAR